MSWFFNKNFGITKTWNKPAKNIFIYTEIILKYKLLYIKSEKIDHHTFKV